MEYRAFPATGDKVSAIGFGTMGLGGAFGAVNIAEGVRSIHFALDNGVNFFDTARHYGNAEEILGRALREWKGEKPFIATKIQSHGKDNTRWAIPPKVEETFPRHRIREDTETSLRNLGVERIDLLQLHLYWPNWGTGGYWLDELLELQLEGKIRAIGVSAPDHRHDVLLPLVLARKIDAVQTILNIFDPLALDSLVPACAANGIAVIARCVLDEGGLTGFLNEDTVFEADDFRASYFEEVPRRQYIGHVDALRSYLPAEAPDLPSLALKYAIRHPGVTTALTSMHILEHARKNIGAAAGPPLSDAAFYELYTRHRWVNNLYHSKYWSGANDLDKANARQAPSPSQTRTATSNSNE